MANVLYDALFAPHQGKAGPFLFLEDGTTLSYDTFIRLAARIAHVLPRVGLRNAQRIEGISIEDDAEAGKRQSEPILVVVVDGTVADLVLAVRVAQTFVGEIDGL